MAARAKNRKIFKRQILLYAWADDPLPKELKRFRSDEQNDRQS